MLIREIILENFMSYEYARIPLRPGVNIVCGPNGSGKSSILLGISVALGQSYTERSRRLSDLIRWGKDTGRVTLLLNNSRRKGKRPVPKINKDEIPLTRILRRDGRYWFELDNRPVNRGEVVRLLSRLGVDPDNLLIIMHQNMAEQFVVLSPQERLKMVEAAVGLESYRKNVLEARKKLSRIMSQEESIAKLLASAEQTLSYWREQYDRYQLKKQLTLKRSFLERELAWAEVSRMEEETANLKAKLQTLKGDLEETERRIRKSKSEVEKLRSSINEKRLEFEVALKERVQLEGERRALESSLNLAREILKGLREAIEVHGAPSEEPTNNVKSSEAEYVKASQKGFTSTLDLQIKRLEDMVNLYPSEIEMLTSKITDVQDRLSKINDSIFNLYEELTEEKINLSLLNHKNEELLALIKDVESDLKAKLRDLEIEKAKANGLGPRIAVVRSPESILSEIRETDGRIAALSDVSEDVEKMYNSYSKLYLELKDKSMKVRENRDKALKEVKARLDAWRSVIRRLINDVDSEFKRILSFADAVGSVRVLNDHDIESAGLEIIVGFKGADPVPLNAYTQSGGERSTATMAFLLALQRYVKSPFRAIDEYDIHMDPRNREVMVNLLISSLEGQKVQYLIITPNRLYIEGRDIHVITVQNVGGSSIIRETS
ncbi:hypothetical protein CW702_01735 [Candidatus Bathyarchaeota archaeon]|nr:MAG: hypothetical protein CW702_01735 [Candidatus Bathyarchaeota archaeon]